METIKKRLQELYTQKENIQREISSLENQLKNKPKQPLQNSINTFTKQQKINIFRELFIGTQDIYAKKWQNADKTKENFFPVTRTFKGEDYIPLSDNEIESHLTGMPDKVLQNVQANVTRTAEKNARTS